MDRATAADESRETLVRRAAGSVFATFEAFHQEFKDITRRAAWRQERRDWKGLQADAHERLDLYERVVGVAVQGLSQILADGLTDRTLWPAMRDAYADMLATRVDGDLGETFFNSVTRRVFATVGIDPEIEFVGPAIHQRPRSRTPAFDAHVGRDVAALVGAILGGRRVANQPVAFDAARIGAEIETRWREAWPAASIEAVEVLRPVFYRNKGAYLVGRVRGRGRLLPLVIALVSEAQRVVVDAVLLSENEASIVFSFTRAYFLVDVDSPWETIEFLSSIMPAKRVAELYTSLGYDRHGKAELYRDLLRHLARSTERFDFAPGDAGMVMIVFTLPAYDIVFKVIRDGFAYPKTTTRRQVLERYQLVFKHDRAGRLVDAYEYEHLALPRDRFAPGLLRELQESAGSSVMLDGQRVVLRHVYTERRVRPLNLYLREVAPEAARAAVLDFGTTIKDLAASNIFPGDLLIKNFGVTRHGRVIFYDYDEIGLLTDYTFRTMPEPRTPEEEMAAEPWFAVGPGDVFPSEFMRFMGLYGDLSHVFLDAHRDLTDPAFWIRMQELHRAGEIADVFPYQAERRLARDHAFSRDRSG